MIIGSALKKELVYKTCERAVNLFGPFQQLEKLREELDELAVATRQFEKNPGDVEILLSAIDECADVLITAQQCAIILGEQAVAERILFKTKRLDTIIDKKEKECNITAMF